MARSKRDIELDSLGNKLCKTRTKKKKLLQSEKELTTNIKSLMGKKLKYEGQLSIINLSKSATTKYETTVIAELFPENVDEFVESGVLSIDKKKLHAWCDLNGYEVPSKFLVETRTDIRVLAEAKAS
jgi:hypothetical protein